MVPRFNWESSCYNFWLALANGQPVKEFSQPWCKDIVKFKSHLAAPSNYHLYSSDLYVKPTNFPFWILIMRLKQEIVLSLSLLQR